MRPRLNDGEIHAFWTNQAIQHGQSPAASWSDVRVIEMEIEQISKRLDDGDRVLDIGCANGFSSMQFAARRNVRLRGLDYVPEMIEEARSRAREFISHLKGTVEFADGDITRLEENDDSYDKLVVIRVLINLGNWERQKQALHECVRVLRKGGRLLLSEATRQGWQRLNLLRAEWGLPDIPMPPFNEYLDQERVVAELGGKMRLVEISNFASTYYVGTRVLKPLLSKIADIGVDVANPNTEWNRWCSQLPAAGDYGTQKLFVFEKL
jgi:ubiquinone/menaquinone biosynthesis C-methylase UbiE